MTCSTDKEGVKKAAGSDDPGSHSFTTGSSACMLLISLIQGDRQRWCQLQCLERKGLLMKQMWYQYLLITFKFPPVLLLALNSYLCLHPSNSSSAASKMAVTSLLWS